MKLSDIIAVLALILSIINFIFLVISKYKKLSIEIVSYRGHQFEKYYWNGFGFMIQNKSQLPISITRIEIANYDNTKCEIEKQMVKETTRRI